MSDDIDLPALPEPRLGVDCGEGTHVYFANHMRAYARTAILADRERRVGRELSEEEIMALWYSQGQHVSLGAKALAFARAVLAAGGPATMSLPPLPEPLIQHKATFATVIGYTADQMRDYALTARAPMEQEIARLHATIDKLLAHCPDAECADCGVAVCPAGEWLHFHHDGCPACGTLNWRLPNE